MPNALALTADFMPKRFRVTLVLMAWFGFSIGSGVAGPITAHLLEGHTWRSVFVFGGLLPVLLAPLLLWRLPESLQGLSQRGKHEKLIGATLRRMNPRLAFSESTGFMMRKKGERVSRWRCFFGRDEAG